jgi:hypothetical protein
VSEWIRRLRMRWALRRFRRSREEALKVSEALVAAIAAAQKEMRAAPEKPSGEGPK